MLKRLQKIFSFCLLGLLVTACEGGAPPNTTQEFYVGLASSQDTNNLNLNTRLNSWETLAMGDRWQMLLQQKKTLTVDEPGIWALAIRTPPNPTGVVQANTISVKLFSNYSINKEKCCTNTLQFEDFDVADESYIAVGGYINFTSMSVANFDLDFQKENSVGSGQLLGPIIKIKGCWHIGGEYEKSGCSL